MIKAHQIVLSDMWGLSTDSGELLRNDLKISSPLGVFPKSRTFLERNIENDEFRQIQEQRRAKAQR
jgi:hypothetical protein